MYTVETNDMLLYYTVYWKQTSMYLLLSKSGKLGLL